MTLTVQWLAQPWDRRGFYRTVLPPVRCRRKQRRVAEIRVLFLHAGASCASTRRQVSFLPTLRCTAGTYWGGFFGTDCRRLFHAATCFLLASEEDTMPCAARISRSEGSDGLRFGFGFVIAHL
jgi:hypothetical protein